MVVTVQLWPRNTAGAAAREGFLQEHLRSNGADVLLQAAAEARASIRKQSVGQQRVIETKTIAGTVAQKSTVRFFVCAFGSLV